MTQNRRLAALLEPLKDVGRAWRAREMERKRSAALSLLSGSGIEIGALHRPCKVPDLDVKYVDRMTKAEVLEQYPELKDEEVVEEDIIDDAETLSTIPDASQDFVIANHVIEHMANPIRAILTWARVITSGGHLFLAVPDKHRTFDREREITPLEHLVLDFEQPSRERDYLAFEEVALLVGSRHFKGMPEEDASAYAKELFDKDYSIHYHVWDFPSFRRFLEYMSESHSEWGMRIVRETKTVRDEFLYVLAKR